MSGPHYSHLTSSRGRRCMHVAGNELLESAIRASVSTDACHWGAHAPCANQLQTLDAAVLQEEDSHALEELLGFPLLKDGTRLGWLMNLNSVRHLHYPPCHSPLQALLLPLPVQQLHGL